MYVCFSPAFRLYHVMTIWNKVTVLPVDSDRAMAICINTYRRQVFPVSKVFPSFFHMICLTADEASHGLTYR